MDFTLTQRAHAFAADRHEARGQVRKYTGEPYIVHPAAVAGLVASVPHNQAMLAAAFLHDVLEDTDTTYHELVQAFGVPVAQMVLHLTDYSRLLGGNRAARKRWECDRLSRTSGPVQTIKLADLIDNARSIMVLDKKFAPVFAAEARALAFSMSQGDQTLRELLFKVLA